MTWIPRARAQSIRVNSLAARPMRAAAAALVAWLLLTTQGPLLPALADGAAPAPSPAPDRAAFLDGVPADLRSDVSRALDLAGDNAPALMAGVCGVEGERERRWACWLVAHMPDKVHVRCSPEGRVEHVQDLRVVTADMLAHHVRLAAAARERFPWARDLPEELYLENVLPHRFTEEPLEDWRAGLWGELEPLAAKCPTAEEAVLAINRWAAERFKYVPRGAEDLGILSALKEGKGRCEDMSNLVRAALATCGLPAASVYTPWWPRGDGNHAWNEVYLAGAWRQFMGCEPTAEPPHFDRMKKDRVFAKVYRCGFVRGRNAPEDVTAEYTPVRDLDLRLDAPDAPVELCVMNMGEWRGVASARTNAAGRVRFANVGCRDALLFRARTPDGKVGTAPFIARGPGSPGAPPPEL
ncbi:MAG: transglutaminase domain-containing protein [Planctomycetes bacterium]|nr:transglutaminase domain-containing protein [Planctomycetota bacterium]